MKINGTEYNVVMTNKTPEEISVKFDQILNDNGKREEVDELLSQYPALPQFVHPYLLAIYFKHNHIFKEAADLMDEAISKLQSDSISHSSKNFFDKATYYTNMSPLRSSYGLKQRRYMPTWIDSMIRKRHTKYINYSAVE